ncbi:alpha/beta hydrolase-fold protein [Allorhizobium sp. BGMRC 0089]|uniref:alpha/beta hydrolase n=1 Tax=Allorhizobium sonneratiae TaxID=2934936 RepID=UPI002033B27C|nr:alpha/beta hydrolase-fold protein [Allorhizobium sonneratiae]MCM2293111.1 alpha/beta hydrolase-fold protein [Allorhizobium sonneratiae]
MDGKNDDQLHPFIKADCFYHDLHDGAESRIYRIFVHLPRKAAPETGWPVLYLTDGNACFLTAVDAMQVQASYPQGTDVEDGVVVAIGYPTDEPYDPFRRSWDLSPPPVRAHPPFFAGGPEVMTGGANEFLDFIEAQLKPWLAGLVRIDPARQTLFGHSFGGLFTLHALFAGPERFQRYVSASPAIYWENAEILDEEQRFLARGVTSPIELHLSAGEYEGDRIAPFHKGTAEEEKRLENARKIRTVGMARDMAERLNGVMALKDRVVFEEFAGENHMSVLPVAVNRAVQIAFRRLIPRREDFDASSS